MCIRDRYKAIRNKMTTGSLNMGDLGEGFADGPATAFLVHVVSVVIATVGFCLCVIPGLIIGTLYMFAMPIATQEKTDFWTALEQSRKIVWTNFLPFAALTLLLAVISTVGFLCCVIGSIFTVPYCFAVLTCAYDDVRRQLAGQEE